MSEQGTLSEGITPSEGNTPVDTLPGTPSEGNTPVDTPSESESGTGTSTPMGGSAAASAAARLAAQSAELRRLEQEQREEEQEQEQRGNLARSRLQQQQQQQRGLQDAEAREKAAVQLEAAMRARAARTEVARLRAAQEQARREAEARARGAAAGGRDDNDAEEAMAVAGSEATDMAFALSDLIAELDIGTATPEKIESLREKVNEARALSADLPPAVTGYLNEQIQAGERNLAAFPDPDENPAEVPAVSAEVPAPATPAAPAAPAAPAPATFSQVRATLRQAMQQGERNISAVDGLRTAVGALQTSLAEKTALSDQLQATNYTLESTIRDKETAIATLRYDMSVLQGTIASLEERENSLTVELDQSNQSNQAQVDDLRRELAENLRSKEELSSQNNMLASRVRTLTSELDSVRTELENIVSIRDTNTVELTSFNGLLQALERNLIDNGNSIESIIRSISRFGKNNVFGHNIDMFLEKA